MVLQRRGHPQRQRAYLSGHGEPVQRRVRSARVSSPRPSNPSLRPPAEATLFVSTTPSADSSRWIPLVDRGRPEPAKFVVVPAKLPKAVAQAGAGKVGVGERAVIVDPESASELLDGRSARSGSAART